MTLTTPDAFMAAAPAPLNGSSPWAARYAAELRRVVVDHAERAPRSLQVHLGPSELGVACDRQVVGKLAGLPKTNHVSDPWPSIVGTAIHAWLADAFTADNTRKGVLRWVAEQRVVPHPEHSGTADLYDAAEQRVVDHKGIHVDTPIPTPDGWTTAGQLAPGDEVFGADGYVCRVIRTYPAQLRDCYRVRFTDGTSLVADDVQELPFARYAGGRLHPAPMSVAEAADRVWTRGKHPQRQLRIYSAAPLALPDVELTVHPYVLGCWLGDGGRHGGQIAKPDDALFEAIEACGYTVGRPIGKRGLVRTVYGLSTQLQQLGLQWRAADQCRSHHRLDGAKAIPRQYLRGAYSQRLALLQGLMDTDGTWNRCRNQAVFTTTDKGLAEGAAELVASLGWKARIYPQQAHGYGLTVTAYHVTFVPFDANPFRLPRKASLVRIGGTAQARYRLVHSIEPLPSVPTRCIDVDSADHLYLAGEQMLPVHNCLGDSTLAKIRAGRIPRHYLVQLLLYAHGYRQLGLPVRGVALAAWPRTASTLDGLYVWERPHTEADDQLITEVLQQTQTRKAMAQLLISGLVRFDQIPNTPDNDSCYFCPFFRPEAARDGGPGCAGTSARTTPTTALEGAQP